MLDKTQVLTLLLLGYGGSQITCLADETNPIKGGVNQEVRVAPNPEIPFYPKPTFIQTGTSTDISKPALKTPVKVPVKLPVKAAAAKMGYLPPEFLGVWQVMGSRSAIEAQAIYQQAIGGIFSGSTTNTWRIQGNPQGGYFLSTDTGVSTPLQVKSQGNSATIIYQHPINKTMAKEELKLQLQTGGVQFIGTERIAIVKVGEPEPRAKVTYKLVGRRQ